MENSKVKKIDWEAVVEAERGAPPGQTHHVNKVEKSRNY